MITFRPAKREQTPLIVGIAGPTGSGKSLSALRLASGLAQGRPVFVINSEGARGHLYADRFPFPTYDLAEPFSLARYREAIEAAAAEKPAVLIIDQISSAHDGPGGMLDQHEAELDRRAGSDYTKRERMTWAAWVKPKAEEGDLISCMLRQPFHIILCMRAKEKLKIVKGKDPEPLGWQPICSDRMTFETLVTLVLPPGSKGRPDFNELGSKNREPLLEVFKGVDQIDEDLGRRLAAWAQGGAVDVPARLRACASLEALQQAWQALPAGERKVPANIVAKDARKADLIATQQKGGEPPAADLEPREKLGSDAGASLPQGAPVVSLASLLDKMQSAAKARDRDLLDAHADLIQYLPVGEQPEAGAVFNECRAMLEGYV